MNIIDALIQLRDDIKTWVTTNIVALNAKIDSKTIPIDSELNPDSTNPVQNKAVAEKVAELSSAIENASSTNIIDDESGEFAIADPNGNVVAKVDSDGVTTTKVNADEMSASDNEYVIADPNGNIIFKVDADGAHAVNSPYQLAKKNGYSGTEDEFWASFAALLNVGVATITFYVDGELCVAEYGMTWDQWIASPYKHPDVSSESDGIVRYQGANVEVSGMPVLAIETIVPGKRYDYAGG